MNELEEMLLDLDQGCTEIGFLMSSQKTKILEVTSDLHDTPKRVTLQGVVEPVEVVKTFEYLGSVVTSVCRLWPAIARIHRC